MMLFTSVQITAQVAINSDGNQPDISSMLDVKSTSKGMLVPRMTAAERDAISNPAIGLLIFCTTNNQFYSNKGTPAIPNWMMVSSQWVNSGPDLYFSGGKVGIGNLSPSYHLDVTGDINFSGILRYNGLPVATGVSSVSASSPVVSSGGTTPNISLPQANATTHGYLSFSDWNLFNNKQNTLTFGNVQSPDMTITGGGTVVGSGLNLSVNKGNLTSPDLTITGGSSSVLGSGTNMIIKKGSLTESSSSVLIINYGTEAVLGIGTSIQVKQANSAQSGYLSNTDWNTFNNKQELLTFGNLTSNDITVTGGIGAIIGQGSTLTVNKGDLIEAGSSVLIISNGGNAILGAGASIQVKQANTSQSGYLSVIDWNSFNNKVSSQWTSNGQNLYYNSGNIGIGSTNPQNKLDIAGNTVIGASYSGTNSAPTNGLMVEGHVAIGTTSQTSTAAFEVASTNSGVLLPRMTQAQIEAISNPANGLVVFCTTDNKFYSYLSNHNKWRELAFGNANINPGGGFLTCGDPITVNHVTTGGVAPVNKSVSYVTVTNIPGETLKCWIASNLGADHQATAINDPTEASAGWYWQFNRKQGYKHDGTTRTPNTTWISSINENSNWTAANDPCTLELGSDWRIPTATEWSNIDASGSWTTWIGPWNSDLKLHAAGWLSWAAGDMAQRGSIGSHWGNSQYNTEYGKCHYFDNVTSSLGNWNKSLGITLRCIK